MGWTSSNHLKQEKPEAAIRLETYLAKELDFKKWRLETKDITVQPVGSQTEITLSRKASEPQFEMVYKLVHKLSQLTGTDMLIKPTVSMGEKQTIKVDFAPEDLVKQLPELAGLKAQRVKPHLPPEKPAEDVTTDTIAHALLFNTVEEEFLKRISPTGEIPADERQHTQEYLLMLIANHLEILADSVVRENESKSIRVLADNIKKLRKGLQFLARDSVYEGKPEQDSDQHAFIQLGYDKALSNADFILKEAARVMEKEWKEKKEMLDTDTPEALIALIDKNDSILAYKRQSSDTHYCDVAKCDPDLTVDAYTDAIRAKTQALLALNAELGESLTPALRGRNKG